MSKPSTEKLTAQQYANAMALMSYGLFVKKERFERYAKRTPSGPISERTMHLAAAIDEMLPVIEEILRMCGQLVDEDTEEVGDE